MHLYQRLQTSILDWSNKNSKNDEETRKIAKATINDEKTRKHLGLKNS